MKRTKRPATAVIGAGRLARSFLPPIAAAGYPVLAVADLSLRAARSACRGIGSARASTDATAAAEGAALVLLAVPDREIRPVARLLADSGKRSWKGVTVLHHAGAFGPDLLAPLASLGAATGLLHPLQALSAGGSAALLQGSYARIEGDAGTLRTARRLARDIGLVPLRFTRPLRPSDRTGYHAAASIASNDLLALLAIGADRMEAAGLDRRDTIPALLALAAGALANLERDGTLEGALSGPVSRGDAEVVASQLRSLRSRSRDAAEIHRLLSHRLLKLAADRRLLDRGGLASLRRVLRPDPGRTARSEV